MLEDGCHAQTIAPRTTKEDARPHLSLFNQALEPLLAMRYGFPRIDGQ
jgi:hypothetical protein